MLEDGRGEMGDVGGWSISGGRGERQEGFHARVGVGVGDVGIRGGGCFEAETDGFAAAGDGGPVVEEIGC